MFRRRTVREDRPAVLRVEAQGLREVTVSSVEVAALLVRRATVVPRLLVGGLELDDPRGVGDGRGVEQGKPLDAVEHGVQETVGQGQEGLGRDEYDEQDGQHTEQPFRRPGVAGDTRLIFLLGGWRRPKGLRGP